MQFSVEKVIFTHLLQDREYGSKVLPYLKTDYFSSQVYKTLFEVMEGHVNKYHAYPSPEAVKVDLTNRDNLLEDVYTNSIKLVDEISKEVLQDTDPVWLLNTTEQFCQEQAIHNALSESIRIREDKTRQTWGKIPQILSDALAVSFDSNLGHDYLEDYKKRYEFYHQQFKRVPLELEYLDRITRGGFKEKTLNLIIGGVNVGKSLIMCSMAAYALMRGFKVLYITLEMAEEEICRRIDANVLDVAVNDIEGLPRESYYKKVERVLTRTNGKLLVKEYPSSTASCNDFRHYIRELKLKKKFVPDIIFIDYLNICNSYRHKSLDNSYGHGKAVAEEMRGLGGELKVPIVSGCQFNRKGFESSNPGLSDMAESFAIAGVADFAVAVTSNEIMDKLGQYLFKQVKNRYSRTDKYRKWLVGVDKDKMRLFDLDPKAQESIIDDSGIPDEEIDQIMNDSPVMDNTEFGERDKIQTGRKFEGFK